MKNFIKKPYRWAIIYTLLLILSSTYILLDTFVLPEDLTASAMESSDDKKNHSVETLGEVESEITASSYTDENIQINIETIRKYNSTIYIADIQVSDVQYLQTALAKDTYGRNITETTSQIAEENNAIFAINGDYYGFRDDGLVLRNGTLYRDITRSGNHDALMISDNGDLSVESENEVNMDLLVENNTWQVLSFGPALINNSEIVVNESSEVAKAKTSNPRTAIGQISPLHYLIVVSDGRTDESTGLSLLELASIFEEKNCSVAYNLDGGGSSTMYFNGEVINNPTSGRSIGERKVSDIVYFGY